MGKIFDPESGIMQTLGRLGDLMLLSMLFFVTSLPIITIGASATAVYTVCFRFGTERETGVISGFFKAFRDNFKQATILWILLLAVLIASGFSVLFFSAQQGSARMMAFPGLILILFLVFVTGYLFPLLSQFSNTNHMMLRNAMLLSIAYLPRSLVIAVAYLFPLVLFILYPVIFLRLVPMWFALYSGCISFMICRMLRKVFAPLYPQDSDPEESEAESEDEEAFGNLEDDPEGL